MLNSQQTSCLTGQFLMATPQIKEAPFAGSLIYLIEHDAEGASGIIVNQPLNLSFDKLFSDVLEQASPLTKDGSNESASEPVKQAIYFGGPVANNRGFVLHNHTQQPWESTISIDPQVALTTSRDIIHAIQNHQGPENALIALGYASWTEHQLEQEILDNAWVSVSASSRILFDVSHELRLKEASDALGIDMHLFTPDAGHA